MTAPTTVEEFNARYNENYKTEGFGLGNVFCDLPCFFCAAPNFARYEIMEFETIMTKEHICTECERGAKAIIAHEGETSTLRVVQTCGPDAPDFIAPMIKREE